MFQLMKESFLVQVYCKYQRHLKICSALILSNVIYVCFVSSVFLMGSMFSSTIIFAPWSEQFKGSSWSSLALERLPVWTQQV